LSIKELIKKRPNEFVMIICGFAFFLNPMIILFDLLPDFIGCALIMYALNRLSPIAPDFDNAFNYFKYMVFVSVGRLLISLASSGFDSVTYLSVSLILGIVESAIAVMALSSLYEGLSAIGIKYNTGISEPTELKNVGIAFFVIRGFCSMLPYITSVLDRDDDIITGESYAPAMDYTALLMLANVIITVIFAVFFMTVTVSFFGRLSKNRELCSSIHADLDEKSKKEPEFFLRRNMTFALTLLAYSPLFLIDFIGGLPDGGRNFVPDFFFGIFVIWAVLLLGKHLSGYKPVAIFGAVYTLFSAVNFFVYNEFLKKHYYTDYGMLTVKFLNDYIVAVVFAVLETVSLIALAIKLSKFLMPIATRYSFQDVPPEFVKLTEQNERAKRNSAKLLNGFCIALCFIALAGTALTAVLQMFDVGYGDINFPYLLAHVAVNIAFYGYASTVFLRMRAGVKKRYERPSDIL